MLLGRSILGISAIVFISYGLVSLVSPTIPSEFAGLVMSNGDAFAEIGAMYGGLQTGMGLFCLLALLKVNFYQAGLVVLVLVIGALGLTRLLFIFLVPEPITMYTYGATIYELTTAMLGAVALSKS